MYDEANNIIGFDYTNNNITNRYYLLKNILGDVIKIVDNNSNIVVEYLYSAYGSVLQITGTLASTIGLINPIRYRSYYYDNDTNMYYLKTIQVIEDVECDNIEIYNNYYVNFNEMTNGTFLLHLEQLVCPFPMFNYYSWSLSTNNDYYVCNNGNGYFTVNSIGNFVLHGTYLLTNRIIHIHINIYIL